MKPITIYLQKASKIKLFQSSSFRKSKTRKSVLLRKDEEGGWKDESKAEKKKRKIIYKNLFMQRYSFY